MEGEELAVLAVIGYSAGTLIGSFWLTSRILPNPIFWSGDVPFPIVPVMGLWGIMMYCGSHVYEYI